MSVTLPFTVTPFNRTACPPVTVTFPPMVMVECMSRSTVQVWAELPV